MAYAYSTKQLKALYEASMADTLLAKHPTVEEYVKNIYERKELGAICYLEEMLICDNVIHFF